MVPDGSWERIKPLLPVVPRRADHPGRKRLDDRKVLCGILFVLYTGIPVIARRGTEHGSGLGVHRWVVEQSIALLHWFRRLRIRWQIRDDIHEAFLSPACSIICWRRLINLSLC
jgi:transposase